MTTDEPPADDGSSGLANPAPTTGEHPGGPRADEPPFPAIAERVADSLAGGPAGHGMDHAWRVFRLGTRLAETEGADAEVVGAAALTHDLHRAAGDGTGVAPAETTDEVREVLEAAGFPEEKIPAVQHCVAVHDEYAFRGDDPQPGTTEAEVLRDADNLDAMGAIGVARTFAFGGAVGTPLWDPDGEAYSQLYHVEEKLLELREEMHTDAAREIAAERHAFLEAFHERFRQEWRGER